MQKLTSPGYFGGPGEREHHGLSTGTGPYRVIAQFGVYGFPEETRRMTLLNAFEGVTLEEIQENSGFVIDVDPN